MKHIYMYLTIQLENFSMHSHNVYLFTNLTMIKVSDDASGRRELPLCSNAQLYNNLQARFCKNSQVSWTYLKSMRQSHYQDMQQLLSILGI